MILHIFPYFAVIGLLFLHRLESLDVRLIRTNPKCLEKMRHIIRGTRLLTGCYKVSRAGRSVSRQVFETWICDYRWSVWFCWTLSMKMETWFYWRPCACLLWCLCAGHWWAASVQQRHMQPFGLDVHKVSLWKLQYDPNGTVGRFYKMTSLVTPVFSWFM